MKKGILEVEDDKIRLKLALGIGRWAGVGGIGSGEEVPFNKVSDMKLEKSGLLGTTMIISTDYGIDWEISIAKRNTFETMKKIWTKVKG